MNQGQFRKCLFTTPLRVRKARGDSSESLPSRETSQLAHYTRCLRSGITSKRIHCLPSLVKHYEDLTQIVYETTILLLTF